MRRLMLSLRLRRARRPAQSPSSRRPRPHRLLRRHRLRLQANAARGAPSRRQRRQPAERRALSLAKRGTARCRARCGCVAMSRLIAGWRRLAKRTPSATRLGRSSAWAASYRATHWPKSAIESAASVGPARAKPSARLLQRICLQMEVMPVAGATPARRNLPKRCQDSRKKRFEDASALRLGQADGGACCPQRAEQSQTAGTAISTLTRQSRLARCGGGAASSRGRRRNRRCAGAPPAPGGTGQ